MPEADGLQRREFVGGGDREGSARHPSARAIPGQHVAEEATAGIGDAEREQSSCRPGQEITGREDERGNRRPPLRHLRVQSDRRRDGREHHRGHHHEPDAEEPAECPEGGARSLVHAAHAIDRRPPGESGEREQQRDEPEPTACRREGRPQTTTVGGSRVRRCRHSLRRPRRIAMRTRRTCPRTRCRTR